MTCALKNLKGCLPDREKRRFHALGLTKPIAALGAFRFTMSPSSKAARPPPYCSASSM